MLRPHLEPAIPNGATQHCQSQSPVPPERVHRFEVFGRAHTEQELIGDLEGLRVHIRQFDGVLRNPSITSVSPFAPDAPHIAEFLAKEPT